MALPDFCIIGAMKCGTTTLAAQLSHQDGVFICTPKEPNFFSDDQIFARGMGWYGALFATARASDLKGDASTHYTKLPTWPAAAARMHAAIPAAKLIYLVRDPVERLVSHYIHDWSMGAIRCSIDEAVIRHPELVEYGRYSMQLRPYVDRFAPRQILVIRLEDIEAAPQPTFERIGAFLDKPGEFTWRHDLGPQNVSRERIKRFPMSGLVLDHPLATWLRRRLVPRSIRAVIRRRLQMDVRPTLSPAMRAQLSEAFARDMAAWPSELGVAPPYPAAP